MPQTGFIKHLKGRNFEDYVSMKKYSRSRWTEKELIEHILHRTQTTPTSATPAEFEETGGLTIASAGKTNLTLLIAGDTDAGADSLHGATVTMHYFTNAGIATDLTVTLHNTATTEVACMANFYCWNLRDYTINDVIKISIVVPAGVNIYIGLTGMVAGAEKRYATIAAAALIPTAASLFGVGNVFTKEETNTAGDVGKVITLTYWTPWGYKYIGIATLAANTETIVRFVDATTGYPVLDYYRRYSIETTGLLGKYVGIGIDADKVVGTVVLDTWYGVIEEGNYESVHSRKFVPAAVKGKLYLGDCHLCQTSKDYPFIFYIYCTPKGCVVEEVQSWSFTAGTDITIDLAIELEPATDVTFKIADDAAHPVAGSVTVRCIEIEV